MIGFKTASPWRKYRLLYIHCSIGGEAVMRNNLSETYCNPIKNIDYGYTPIPNTSRKWRGRHRATLPIPVIMPEIIKEILFTLLWLTNGVIGGAMIYWTGNLYRRNFFVHGIRFMMTNCVPAVGIIGGYYARFQFNLFKKLYHLDELPIQNYVNGKPYSYIWFIWYRRLGPWFFTDDDGKILYVQWQQQHPIPLYGIGLTAKQCSPWAEEGNVFIATNYGCSKGLGIYGQYIFRSLIEGAWMTKHNGKYYLQYERLALNSAAMQMGWVVGRVSPHRFFYTSQIL